MELRADPILKTLLLGCYCEESPLHILLPYRKIFIKVIFDLVQRFYASRIDLSTEVGEEFPDGPQNQFSSCFDVTYWSGLYPLQFPPPSGLRCNMLPFVYGDELKTLPEKYHGYLPLIAACKFEGAAVAEDRQMPSEEGKVVYLTIDESVVKQGETQRRAGLHTECPGEIQVENVPLMVYWGFGYWSHGPVGGIWMASTTANSTAYYDVRIQSPEQVVSAGGNVEHLRYQLDSLSEKRRNVCQPHHLYWMTDCTPHEALPAEKEEMRQFFRLVQSSVTVWYEDHSTANPLCKPSAKIIKGSKFVPI
jgi:hypothetical protein